MVIYEAAPQRSQGELFITESFWGISPILGGQRKIEAKTAENSVFALEKS